MAVSSPTPDRTGLEIRPSPGLPAIELHVGAAVTHSHPAHWHDEYFVTAITEGEGVFRFRGQAHRVPAGTMMLVVPGEIHAHVSGPAGRSFRSLHAVRALVAGLAPELPPLRSTPIAEAGLVARFLSLHRLLEGDGSLLRKETRLLTFFVELAGRSRSSPAERLPGPERAAVRRAQELLDDSGSSRVTLRELAEAAGLSPFHLHRLFRTQVGLPPHEYHLRRRLVRARELLGSGQPIADVAAETGFADQSHLTRHFKRLLGMPPAVYARSKNVQDAGAARS